MPARVILKVDISNKLHRRCSMYAGVFAFIGGTIIVGFSIGLWVEGKLIETDQNVKL